MSSEYSFLCARRAGALGVLCAAIAIPWASRAADQTETASQLRITTDPPGAVVACDGKLQEIAPCTFHDLPPGDHLLVVKKKGFREQRRTISMEQGQRLAVQIPLEPLLGLVLVRGHPHGAEVRIDGASRGALPLLLTDLAVGTYRVDVSSPGFLAKELELRVEDRTPVKLEVNLTPDSARLTVETSPQGATVTLNGIQRGTAPCTLDQVPAGQVRLELALGGFAPYAADLKLVPGETRRVSATLDPIPAHLRIVTEPAGARVYVQDEFRGVSPVAIEGLPAGRYDIRAERPGYDPASRTVTLANGQKATEELRLLKNCGQLEVTTQPAGVRVFLDGKDMGVTQAPADGSDQISRPFRLEGIPPGLHEVTLTRTRYYEDKIPVQIERDQTTTLHRKLKRRFIPDYEVRTATEVYRGVLLELAPDGDVKLEILPGIIKSIPAKNIRSRGPVRTDGAP